MVLLAAERWAEILAALQRAGTPIPANDLAVAGITDLRVATIARRERQREQLVVAYPNDARVLDAPRLALDGDRHEIDLEVRARIEDRELDLADVHDCHRQLLAEFATVAEG